MLVARELKENGIIADEEKTKKVILQGLPTIIRIAEKLWPENHDPEHLENASSALYEGVENPLHILKQAGIDIEPELEEFREFLAEISGKKIEKKPAPTLVKSEVPGEVLAIAKALEFSDFSKSAMKKAEKELIELIDYFVGEDNVWAVFHAVKLLRLVQKEDVEGIKRFGG